MISRRLAAFGLAAALVAPTAVACDRDTERSAENLGEDLQDEANDVNLDDDKAND